MVIMLLKRFVQLTIALLIASFIVFVGIHLTPGDPAVVMSGGRQTSKEVLDAIRIKYHLSEPVPVQYVYWLGNAIKGDLGESFKLKQGVSELLASRFPLTLQLIIMSILISLIIAVPFGVLAALSKNSWLDRLITTFALVGLSSPVFFSGIIGVLVFSYSLGWLPAFGSGKNIIENLRFFLMPSCALALNMIALSMRITRAGMIEVLQQNYITTALVKGLPRMTIIIKHALRNALIPLVTITGLQIGFLLTSTALIEFTFGIGGIGGLLINAIQDSDYPVVQGTTLFVILAFLLINLLVDVIYSMIDPRIRFMRDVQ